MPASDHSPQAYVTDVLRRYGRDERVLIWDLYNEPCNAGFDHHPEKAEHSTKLTRTVFEWARAAAPSQPLTVCTWNSPQPMDEHDPDALTDYQRHLLEAQTFAVQNSDIIRGWGLSFRL